MRRWWSLVIYILVGGMAFLWLVKVPILSYCLTENLRVPVFLEWVSIWPSKTVIRDFRIDNPKNFSSPAALESKKTEIDYQWRSLFADPLTIQEISLDGVTLFIEFSNIDGSKNNWTAIGDHMPKRTTTRSIFVDKLLLTDLTIQIQSLEGTTSRHIDRLEINDINSARGFPTEQMIHEIFGGADLDDYIKDVFDPIRLLEDVVHTGAFEEERV